MVGEGQPEGLWAGGGVSSCCLSNVSMYEGKLPACRLRLLIYERGGDVYGDGFNEEAAVKPVEMFDGPKCFEMHPHDESSRGNEEIWRNRSVLVGSKGR